VFYHDTSKKKKIQKMIYAHQHC